MSSFDYYDGDEVYTGFPQTYEMMVKMTTPQPARVKKVGVGPDGTWVEVECPSLWGPVNSHCIPCGSNHCANNDTGRAHTGLYNPMQPNQYCYVTFAGGNQQKPVASPAGTTCFDEGTLT